MILLLGKDDYIKKFVKYELIMDMEKDIMYYPTTKTHYSEFNGFIKDIKNNIPSVLISQNKEFIELLLQSDLDFGVWTVYEDDIIRRMSKEEALHAIKYLGLELR